MFVSHEKNVSKKPFQKPNILRRKPKTSVTRPIASVAESLEAKSLATSTKTESVPAPVKHEEFRHESGCNKLITKSVVWKLTTENNNCQGNELNLHGTDVDASVPICSEVGQINYADKTFDRNSLNIDSFINTGASEESLSLLNIDTAIDTGYSDHKITQAETKWCLNLSNSMDIIINNDSASQIGDQELKQNFIIGVVPSVVTPSLQELPKVSLEEVSSTTPPQSVSVDCFTNRAVKFKCDEPDCNKGFWSEERLKKHKNSHKRQTTRASTQIKIECPVKKVNDDGTEQRCESTFLVRGDLLKHLNTDHTPEDALHRCGVCGRRFWWAAGLRAHGASLCARGGLACAWPGCGRVFRLPCRLREHARAHTGDRPYLCRYPNCGWAFRSASKLVRHARRHTDERRHACAACGRAFLRREHLRDHAARHHAPQRRPHHVCTHAGCGQTFTNMSTLYMHMKKVHRKDENETVAADAADVSSSPATVKENVYLVSLLPESQGEAASESLLGGGDMQWHAARTHCTWPLPRQAPAAFVLEEDVQVEQADGSSNNVYTVRSDLFLHGNVAIDEDSQHMGASEIASSATPLDTDLDLIDSHPTIDLMQEELMYDDTAVDESSFRVLLMNGEELT